MVFASWSALVGFERVWRGSEGLLAEMVSDGRRVSRIRSIRASSAAASISLGVSWVRKRDPVGSSSWMLDV